MKNYSILISIALALCVSCGDERTAYDHNTMDHSKMDHGTLDHAKMESSPGAESAPYELQFIDTMIVHHQGAIDMAKLAETRAAHAELKTLAKNILAEQEKEIAQMSEWRAKRYGERAAAVNSSFPGMREGMKGMDMKKLESLTGNAFDLEFIRQMIPHHEGAVIMAKDTSGYDTHAEIKTLSNTVIKAQEAEIRQMKGWLVEWNK